MYWKESCPRGAYNVAVEIGRAMSENAANSLTAVSPVHVTGDLLVCDVASYAFAFVYPISAWNLGV